MWDVIAGSRAVVRVLTLWPCLLPANLKAQKLELTCALAHVLLYLVS